MGKLQETVLYYHPVPDKEQPEILSEKHVRLLKSVLVRMGVRIKNIRPEQLSETVGYLAGIPGYPSSGQTADTSENKCPPQLLCQDMLLLHYFTDSQIDSLLLNLRKSGVPPIALKAIITPQNAGWTMYRLYDELKKEHEALRRDKE